MDLILWRHAQAQDALPGMFDTDRELTAVGLGQAERMVAWLNQQLPGQTRILVSPARRCVQTAQALERPYELCKQLAVGTNVAAVLRLVGWPDAQEPVLIVGHQPTLGQVIAQLLQLPEQQCSVKKAAVWWLRSNAYEQAGPATVVATQLVQSL